MEGIKMTSKEFIKCPCGASDYSISYFIGDYRIVKCRSCGLSYVNPRISAKEQKAMYEDNRLDDINYLLENEEVDRRTFRERLDLLERYMGRSDGHHRLFDLGNVKKDRLYKLLDVGCAIGLLVDEANKRGWNAEGVEFTKKFAEYCWGHSYFDIHHMDFEKEPFPKDRKYDALTMTGVLEHFRNPLKALQKAHSLLEPNGVLLITTPDIGSLHARLLGHKWLQLKPLEHLFYFTPGTLEILLRKAGFEVLLCKHVGNWRTLKTLLIKCGLPAPEWVKKLQLFINPFDEMLVIARKVEK